MNNSNKIIFILILLLLFNLTIALDAKDSSSYSLVTGQSEYALLKYNELCLKAEQSADVDSILKFSTEALDIAYEIEINPARALIIKGNGHNLLGQTTLAVECFTQAAKFDQQHDNTIGLATAYTSLASIYISQQNHSNAKLYLRKAIVIFSDQADSVRLAATLHNLGFEYYRVHQFDSALFLFDSASAVYQNLNYEQENAYCIGNAGLVYSKMSRLDRAEEHLLRAIAVLERYSDARAVADFTNEYASVLQRKGKITPALQQAYKSFGIASTNNISELKRDAAFRLSNIYEQMRRYDSAFHYQLIFYTYSDSIRNLESIQRTADLRTEFEVAQKQTEVDILEKNKTLQRIIIGSLAAIVLLALGLIVIIYLSLNRNRRLTKVLEERRKLLEIQSNELRELNRIKDRFFSIISHDLRTPIASISGISYLIKESIEQDNKVLLNQATDYIDQSVVSLTGLLENLLNWALSQQGKFPFRRELIDLEIIIGEVVKSFASIIVLKNQHFVMNLEKNVVISADKNSMMTILRNLVSNALKFTPRGGTITISSRAMKDGHAEMKVEDTGIGIPEEKIALLFKLHEDKSSRGTENEKGIGLGLNLVHDFVLLNQGDIKIESRVGEGSSFILHFPINQ